MNDLVEMKKMLEKQLQLLSEQVVNVGKFLLDVSPAANRMTGAKS